MRPAFAESLEPRRLLTIVVTATGGNDSIRVASDSGSVLIVVNGIESRFAPDPAGIIINAGDGLDTLRLEDASGLQVTLNGEAANDQFFVGNGNVRAARLAGVDIVGGVGTDSLTVDDTLASTGNPGVVIDNPIDTYVSIVAAPGSIIRSDASTVASAVENITFNGTSQADSIDIRGTNALATLTINVGNGDDSCRIGNDLDTTFKGPATLNGGAGANVMAFDDSADFFSDTYFFVNSGSYGTLHKSSGGATASFAGFGNVTLYAGVGGNVASNQVFRVTSLPDAMSTTIFAGAGTDKLFLGDGITTLDTFKASLTFDGGDDVDSITYNDTLGNDAAAYVIGASSLTNTGTGSLSYLNSESILLTANGAANDIRVNPIAEAMSVTIDGGAGNDTFRVGAGDLDSSVGSGVSVIGNAGVDTLLVDDSLDDVGDDTYTITAGQVRKFFHAAFWSTGSTDRVETVSIACSPNADIIKVNSTTPTIALNIDAGAGDDSILVTSTTDGTGPATAVTIASGIGRDTLDVNSDLTGSDATVAIAGVTEDLQELRLRAGGRAMLTGGPTQLLSVRGPLTVAGFLDLANATMVASGADAIALTALAKAGYANGAWNGAGATAAIISATAATTPLSDAVAVVLASDIAFPTYNGISTVAGDVIVRYTLAGDANLNRVVDFTDLLTLAQNFGVAGQNWSHGNFNYDATGLVDFADLLVLAQNFGVSLNAANLLPAKTRRLTGKGL